MLDTFYNEIPTSYLTPIIDKRKDIMSKNEIIKILKKSEKFNIFLPYIENYKLDEFVIKGMKIENLEYENKNPKKLYFIITNKSHSKFSIDNIMKKIRVNLINYLASSVSKFLEEKFSEKIEFENLSYSFKSQLRREDNLSDLNVPIKNLLPVDLINKKKLEKILRENEKINDIFNLTFREWIYIFTMEKETTKEVEEIQIEFFYSFLKNILDKNKEEGYFLDFVFCLYNFEKFFISKKKRNS